MGRAIILTCIDHANKSDTSNQNQRKMGKFRVHNFLTVIFLYSITVRRKKSEWKHFFVAHESATSSQLANTNSERNRILVMCQKFQNDIFVLEHVKYEWTRVFCLAENLNTTGLISMSLESAVWKKTNHFNRRKYDSINTGSWIYTAQQLKNISRTEFSHTNFSYNYKLANNLITLHFSINYITVITDQSSHKHMKGVSNSRVSRKALNRCRQRRQKESTRDGFGNKALLIVTRSCIVDIRCYGKVRRMNSWLSTFRTSSCVSSLMFFFFAKGSHFSECCIRATVSRKLCVSNHISRTFFRVSPLFRAFRLILTFETPCI